MAGEAGDNRGALGDDAEIPGRQGGEREPLMLPAPEERKMLPAGEERKLLPSGESDEKTMMAAFEGNTGQSQPIGVDAEIPAVTKAGEVQLIEWAKDKTAEGMARNLCDRIGEWNWQRAGIWAGRSEDSANINIDKANTAKNIFSK